MQGDHSDDDDDDDSDNSEGSTKGTRKLNKVSLRCPIGVLPGTAWTAAVQTPGSFAGFSLSSQL